MLNYHFWKYGVRVHFTKWDFYLSFQPGYNAEEQYGADYRGHGLFVCVFLGVVLKVLHPYWKE